MGDGGAAGAGAGGRRRLAATDDGQEEGLEVGGELFAKKPGINALAAARVVLFGARDVWFVVGVPVFLYSAGWSFTMVGSFLAAWTIGYGLVQALAPQIVRRSADGLSREVPAARLWSALLAAVPMVLAIAVALQVPQLEWVVVAGLGVFGFAFAVGLFGAFLSGARLRRLGEGGRGRRLLLRRQRARPLHRHAAVGAAVTSGGGLLYALSVRRRCCCCAGWRPWRCRWRAADAARSPS